MRWEEARADIIGMGSQIVSPDESIPAFSARKTYCHVQFDEHDAPAGMSENQSFADARRHLARRIREAELGKTLELTRCGQPVALLIGHRMFERFTMGCCGFVATYRVFARTLDFGAVALDSRCRRSARRSRAISNSSFSQAFLSSCTTGKLQRSTRLSEHG